jgi:hypothetical protein
MAPLSSYVGGKPEHKMFYLLSPTKVISIVSVLYAALWVACALLSAHPSSLTVFRTVALLDVILVLWGAWGWRKLWGIFPILNRWLYPDLNGTWDAVIHWVRGNDTGQADGQVHIKQTFFKISIELVSQDSESETSAVVVKRDPESGRPMLHYIYVVKPKQIAAGAAPTYEGCALLKVSHVGIDELAGNYFTSRASSGYFKFVRRRS